MCSGQFRLAVLQKFNDSAIIKPAETLLMKEQKFSVTLKHVIQSILGNISTANPRDATQIRMAAPKTGNFSSS
jgi:hypothetical protein